MRILGGFHPEKGSLGIIEGKDGTKIVLYIHIYISKYIIYTLGIIEDYPVIDNYNNENMISYRLSLSYCKTH